MSYITLDDWNVDLLVLKDLLCTTNHTPHHYGTTSSLHFRWIVWSLHRSVLSIIKEDIFLLIFWGEMFSPCYWRRGRALYSHRVSLLNRLCCLSDILKIYYFNLASKFNWGPYLTPDQSCLRKMHKSLKDSVIRKYI